MSSTTNRGYRPILPGDTTALKMRVEVLEDTTHEYEIWHGIAGGTTGTADVPANATIKLGEYPGGFDGIAVKVDPVTGRPIDAVARDAGGNPITVDGIAPNGDYTLSALADAYPIALIFQIELAEVYKIAQLPNSRILNETMLPNTDKVQNASTVPGLMLSEALDELNSYIQSDRDITAEPTGFAFPGDVIVTYSSAARTITLTGQVDAYYKGERVAAIVPGWVSEPHDAASGTYFLYYDGTDFVWGTTPWAFDNLLIALVFRDTANFCLRECHGLMQWQSHKEFHDVIGTYLASGGDVGGFVLNSTINAERRPTVSQAVVRDEDLPTTLPALTTLNYSRLFLTGANNTNIETTRVEIISVTGSRPNYNLFTGGVWTQAEFPVNAYGKIFLMAIPVTADAECQKLRYVFIQPQFVSTNLSAVQARTPADINLGHITPALAEFVFIGEIIVRFTAGNWRLIEVNKLTGTRFSQVSSPTGSFLSSVATDDSLNGNGTPTEPLGLSGKFTPPADATDAFTVTKADGVTPALIIDTVNDRIGIGRAPQYTFDIVSTGETNKGFAYTSVDSAVLSRHIRINGTIASPTAVQSGNVVGRHLFGGQYGTNHGEVASAADIRAIASANFAGPTNCPMDIAFTTSTALNSFQERMRIKSNGDVGIGTTTPTEKLDVAGNIKLTGSVLPGVASVSVNHTVGNEATVNQSTSNRTVTIPAGLPIGRRITVRRTAAYDGNAVQVSFSGTERVTSDALSNVSIYGGNRFFTFEKVTATLWDIVEGSDQWATSTYNVWRRADGSCMLELFRSFSAFPNEFATGSFWATERQTGISIPSIVGIKAGYKEYGNIVTATSSFRWVVLTVPGNTTKTSDYIIGSPFSTTVTGELTITLNGKWHG